MKRISILIISALLSLMVAVPAFASEYNELGHEFEPYGIEEAEARQLKTLSKELHEAKVKYEKALKKEKSAKKKYKKAKKTFKSAKKKLSRRSKKFLKKEKAYYKAKDKYYRAKHAVKQWKAVVKTTKYRYQDYLRNINQAIQDRAKEAERMAA